MSSTFPKLKSPAILSPMAGVTDVAFRTLAKKYGAGLTCTEFISSTAIVRGNEKTKQLFVTDPSEKPVAVQLFGSNQQDVIDAAKFLEDRFDIFDINCGCPVWKVIKTGAGSALLKEPEKIAKLVNKLATAINKPVTVKIRKGIDDQHINAVEVAKKVEEAGAAAIGIHGRTQQQGYAGSSDWDIIKKVKEAVDIPVIGNGDVFSPEVFKEKYEASGVDYILVARGAMKNPYIFKQINDHLEKGVYDEKDSMEQFKEYLVLAEKYDIPFSLIKTHAMSFTKGIVGGARLRKGVMDTKTIQDLEHFLKTNNKG